MGMPSAVPQDTEREILPPSLRRKQPFPSQNHCLTLLLPLQLQPPVFPQPQASLPLMPGSASLSLPSRQALDPNVLLLPILTPQQTPSSATYEIYTPIPVAMENFDPGLERQRLNALVIASGLADEDELHLWANKPANNSGPSRETNRGIPMEVKSPRDVVTGRYVLSSRTSTNLDEFDEGASYCAKGTDSLFLPYCHPSKDFSPVSKWSLSSSVGIELVNKGRSPFKSLKSKAAKFWSFVSRFSSNRQLWRF